MHVLVAETALCSEHSKHNFHTVGVITIQMVKGKNKRRSGSVGSGRHPWSGDFRGIVAYKVIKERGYIQRGGACFED
jgi:hypothetical protein